ncbi:hypothetical protein ADL19_29710 [Streptomyces purpurogeneiscleroticus]|nr:hypothetical protein ADL19_29710 [Streptomyces purpurogeneiscleroticus]
MCPSSGLRGMVGKKLAREGLDWVGKGRGGRRVRPRVRRAADRAMIVAVALILTMVALLMILGRLS